MNKKVHYLGLDVHKESIAVSIAPEIIRTCRGKVYRLEAEKKFQKKAK